MSKLSLKTISISAAYIAGKLGMKIRFSNNPWEAWTDSVEMVLPCIPESYPPNVLHGFIAHEGGHVKFSHFNEMNVTPLHEKLAGVIEDVRMERAIMKALPGTVGDLNHTVRYAMETGMISGPDDNSCPGVVLISYALAFLRGEYLRQPLIEFLPASEKMLERTFPTGVSVRLPALLCMVEKLNDNNESYDLAGKIIAMLKDEADKLAQKSEDEDENESPTPASNSENETAAVTGEERVEQGTANSSKIGSNEATSKPNNSSSATAEKQLKAIADALGAADTDLPKDLFNEIREQMQASANEAIESGENVVYSIPSGDCGNYSPGDGTELMASARAHSSRIRNQLLILSETETFSGYVTALTGQRLDTHRLSRFVSGDMRIYKKRSEVPAISTAMHLLVDLSSSMQSGGKDKIAIEAALAITMGLKSIPGTDPALTYFLGSSDSPVFPVLEHGQSKVNRMACRVNLPSSGSTPMGEAIRYALFQLAKCNVDKHQMLIVTDGSPNNFASTLQAISECERLGVEMFGVGIGQEGRSVERLFKNSITILSVKDLQTALFNLFKQQFKRAA
ncbi:MAG: VWA domain-containing protein [Gammaproteobacteria bacterium]|nr:MAG: VWA domain-containing protein [Gammaproteobacteria bacterium]